MKVAYILMVWLAAIGFSIAREINRENSLDINLIKNSEYSNVSNDLIEPRKRKPYHDLFFLGRKSGFSTVYAKPLHGIAFMGGLQSLAAFIIIKIKIVLVTIAVIGAVALALKVFGILKYSDYFYKNDRPPIAPPPDYHGYHGPPPQPPIPYDHEIYGDFSPYGEHYRRSSMVNHFSMSVNMTEIMYSFMHVDNDDCRARLICELELMITRSPFFNYFNRHGVTRHRSPSSQRSSENCTGYYVKCVESSVKRLVRRRSNRVKRDDSR